ncbi:hypothetical protein DYB28_002355 [Aphanomyces astaci]|uniref:Transposase Helix-turn-helix domain-containing protein n=1 Tax=Aphanomyces astaci TaxID=112090 RepID=A0A397F3F0_APHAT|nr:hypothetical protein DYB25_011584 [Aphanomyces astaci]RHY17569.1 hypothetical protein DYB36_010598 [Aphanomyces astaci]RHY56582.1 hypothetical protein DYB34_005618 [Aphanomyces astaci]RHZ14009.1 hypothetical protein DYB31_005160 [Aphanomyces astaci]RHZ38617.1 hypothetical protein DYB26_013417 [Aphanomyces astaci]
MYATRDRSTFIAAVSLDPDAFDELLVAFSMHYEFGHAKGRGGRPPKCIQKHEALFLLLHFYCAPCEGKTLCELFRMAPATLARTLTKAERALAVALKSVPDSFIRWNDVDTSSPLRAKLLDEKLTLRGHGVVSDSAVPVSGSMLGKIRSPLKDGDLDRASPECRAG